MFDELVAQVKRLFSSKHNGGRLVYNLTDRLHYYKQILLATSIIFLLGYSQFRPHFECQGSERIDKKTLTNFCWINGTTTISAIHSNDNQPFEKANSARQNSRRLFKVSNRGDELDKVKSNQMVPHVGIQFRLNDRGNKYELINHNYMRSLWALLILMAICSYIAQRRWASIFNHDLLRALLKLPGNEQLPMVKRAQEVKPYEVLMKLEKSSSGLLLRRRRATRPQLPRADGLTNNNNNKSSTPTLGLNSLTISNNNSRDSTGRGEINLEEVYRVRDGDKQLFQIIDTFIGDDNEHNHSLDYYPNQLLYLLLSKRTSAYKLSSLKLRRALMEHSLVSLILSLMQFIFPWSFIGDKYTLYGWNYMKIWFKYMIEQVTYQSNGASRSSQVSSLDYELSSSIWPTLTQCEYKQYGYHGLERFIVQCTVGINEICAKLFVVIWWFVALNIAIEFYSFLKILISSVNLKTIQWFSGRLIWPEAKKEVRLISNFRYKHAALLAKINAEIAEQCEIEALDKYQQQQQQQQQQPKENDDSLFYETETTIAGRDYPTQRGSLNIGSHEVSASGVHFKQQQVIPINEHERKRIEAEGGEQTNDVVGCRNNNKGCFFCFNSSSTISSMIRNKTNKDIAAKRMRETELLDKEEDSVCSNDATMNGLRESEYDSNLYYLLYLLYLRLDCSRKKVEHVIRMTSNALDRYLVRLEQVGWSAVPLLEEEENQATIRTSPSPALANIA